jgi:hypothetical protein
MTTFSTQSQLVRFDEVNSETKPIAVLRLEPPELEERGAPEFCEGYDDLDYLTFSVLSLPFQHRVALVRHKRSPGSGTEVCVVPDESDILQRLVETINLLSLSIKDFSWIHPQYEKKISGKKIFQPSPSTGLAAYSGQQQSKALQDCALKLELYIETDPDYELRNSHPRNFSGCNSQLLTQRMLLKHPPDTLAEISREFAIDYQTLNSHWKRKTLPLLRELAIRFGYLDPYYPEW